METFPPSRVAGIQPLAGILRAAGQHRFAIPARLFVLSCGDGDLVRLASPAVTVVRCDARAIGIAAPGRVRDANVSLTRPPGLT